MPSMGLSSLAISGLNSGAKAANDSPFHSDGFLPAFHTFENERADQLMGAMEGDAATRKFLGEIGGDDPTIFGGGGGFERD